jgi:TRAP-type C4-dicarboxylate transport system permease small subunit
MKDIFKYVYFFLGFSLVSPVFAQEPPRLTDGMLSGMVDKVLSYLFPIAGLICIIFIIQGGYMWMISAGDPARVKQAQGTLTWAVIGFIFVMVIFAVLKGILNFVAK